jgi:hypothetical protein
MAETWNTIRQVTGAILNNTVPKMKFVDKTEDGDDAPNWETHWKGQTVRLWADFANKQQREEEGAHTHRFTVDIEYEDVWAGDDPDELKGVLRRIESGLPVAA